MIVTSAGLDPSDELRTLARRATGAGCVEVAAQGDDPAELDAALSCRPAWVVLKNVHLCSAAGLATLEKRLRLWRQDGGEPSVSVWLTTEPADRVPHSLVVSCVKVAYEAPHGVKRNVRRAYDTWTNESGGGAGDRSAGGGTPDEARSVYALAWFHSVVLERRTYVPQGWSRHYEFCDSDLAAARRVLQTSVRRTGNSGIRYGESVKLKKQIQEKSEIQSYLFSFYYTKLNIG